MYLTSWRSCPIVVSALVPPDVSTRCVSVSGRLHYSKQCFEYFMQILFLSIRLSPGCYLYWWTRVNLNCCDACCMYRNIMITQTWTTCVCYVGRHDANLSSYFRYMVFERTDFFHISVQFTFLSLVWILVIRSLLRITSAPIASLECLNKHAPNFVWTSSVPNR
jgi:hypothetical protein